MTARFVVAVAGLAAAGLLLAQAAAVRGHASVTFDENFYLPAAKRVFLRDDFDVLNGNGVAPLPVLLLYAPAVWAHAEAISDVLWTAAPGDAAALDVARTANVLLVGVPLVFLTGGWVWRRTGSAPAAAAAAALVGLSPMVVAHTALATTDGCFALFFLAALAAVAAHAARPTGGRFLAAGALVGLAVASKYNGVLLLPVGYALGAAADRGPVRRRLFRLLIVHPVRQLGIAAVAFVVCWGVTGFAVAGKPAFDRAAADVPAGTGPRKLVGDGPLGDAVLDLAHAARLPAPMAGFLGQLAQLAKGPDENVCPTYLFGDCYPRGHRLYYVWGVLFKSTPAELVLIALASGGAWPRRLRPVSRDGGAEPRRSPDSLALALGVGLLFVACSLSAKQFGVRYVLPLYPAAVILAVSTLHRRLAGRPALFAAALAAVVASQAYSAVSIAPRPLSYFNTFCGGPDRGPDLLGNSDVDWGQGLRDVRAFLAARGETAVVNKTYGATRGPEYGIENRPMAEPPGCRFVAVGVSRLRRDLRYTPDLLPFRSLAPAGLVGHSVWVYDTTDPAVRAAVRAAAAARPPRDGP